MSPARPRWLTSIAVALTLMTAAAVAQAQDPADAFCALFTPEEVGGALGTKVAAEPGSAGCTWSSTTSGDLATATAGWTSVTLAGQKEAWPDGKDVTIGGRTAYYSPGIFLNELLIEVDSGVLWLVITGYDGDVEAALTELGELAVPRSSSLPPPPQPEPVPSYDADPVVEALFPDTIGGQAVDVLSVIGEEAIFDPEHRAAAGEALATLGKTFDDLSGAFAFSSAGSIGAYRVAGADASAILPLIVGAMGADQLEMTPTQVAGKDVTLVGADTPYYTYAAGEVLWLVQAEEPVLTEIITALP